MRRALLALAGLGAVLIIVPIVFLGTVDINEYRGLLAAEVERRTGRRLVVEGPLALDVSLAPVVSAEGLRFANPPWASRPDMVTARRVEARLALLPLLGGVVEIRRFSLFDADVLLETGNDGVTNWTVGGAAGPDPGRLALRVGRVELDQVELGFLDGVTGARHGAHARRLTLAPHGDSLLDVQVEGTLDGDPLAMRGRIGRLSRLAAPAPYPIALEADVRGLRVSLDAALRRSLEAPSLDGTVTVRADDASAWTGRLAPGVGLSLDASVAGSTERISFVDAVLRFGAARATGQLDVVLTDGRPRLAGGLAVDRLDLDALLASDGPGDAPPDTGKLFSPDSFTLAPLGAFDLRLDLTVGELQVAGATLNELRAAITLAGGRLLVDPLGAGVAASKARGAVEVDATAATPVVSLRLEAARVDAARLLAHTAAGDMVEGLADVSFDLRSRGDSVAALMGNLDGEARLLMAEGRVRARSAELLIGGVHAVLGTMTGGDGEWTTLRCAAADFEIREGIAAPRVLLVDTEHATVMGEGQVDLGAETLALMLTPSPKSTTLNLAVPVRVRGTLARPSFAPDELATARRVGSLALILFPPAAAASFGSLALYSAGAVGAGAAEAGASHPCLDLASGQAQPGATTPSRTERVKKSVQEGLGRARRKFEGLFDK